MTLSGRVGGLAGRGRRGDGATTLTLTLTSTRETRARGCTGCPTGSGTSTGDPLLKWPGPARGSSRHCPARHQQAPSGPEVGRGERRRAQVSHHLCESAPRGPGTRSRRSGWTTSRNQARATRASYRRLTRCHHDDRGHPARAGPGTGCRVRAGAPTGQVQPAPPGAAAGTARDDGRAPSTHVFPAQAEPLGVYQRSSDGRRRRGRGAEGHRMGRAGAPATGYLGGGACRGRGSNPAGQPWVSRRRSAGPEGRRTTPGATPDDDAMND